MQTTLINPQHARKNLNDDSKQSKKQKTKMNANRKKSTVTTVQCKWRRKEANDAVGEILTVALETLVYETVEQRAAVVAERRTAVRVQLELVPVW